jgi:hypothetical protein
MSRFILVSLVLHILLFAVVLGFSFYSPKPKTIQIKLASLPPAASVKKVAPPAAPVVDEKKVEEKKAVEVQKSVDSFLKADVQEKVIEKTIEKPAPIKPAPQPAPKTPIPTPTLPPIPAPTPSPIPTPTPVPVIDNTPNPYLNPVAPTQPPVQAQVQENPYTNPILPQQPAEAPTPAQPTPQLPPVRKTVDVSAAKDDNLGDVVDTIANMPTDIMSSENYSMSDADKKALSNQISQCMASLGVVRENTESITLMFTMRENAKIKDINVIKNNKIVPVAQQSNLENRVIYLFNNPKCATLVLPQGKFTYWQKFTIKINLKGLFG